MKKIIAITSCLLCSACFPEPVPGPTLLETLGENPDPLQLIKTYITRYSKCSPYGMTSAYSCKEEIELAEAGIKFECIETGAYDYSTQKYTFVNTTDECILYRRSSEFHESEVNYFDYKRFLGATSPIKTDKDFLKLVERYNKISECDKLAETTTFEIEACKEKKRNEIRKLAKQSVPCMEQVKDAYVEKLKKAREWYRWAINHDPNEGVRLMRSMGFSPFEASLSYVPVLNHAEARKQVEEAITNFGEENFCTTDNWKAEMKKLGLNL